MEGWICLHRKIREWGWYSDRNTCAVFLELLLSANYHVSTFRGVEVPAGAVVTGRESLAIALGISQQSVRTALTHLKSTNEVTIKIYSKFSVITIINWKSYQSTDQQSDQQVTSRAKTSQLKGEIGLENHRETAEKIADVLLSRKNRPTEKSELINEVNNILESCIINRPASDQQVTTSNKETKKQKNKEYTLQFTAWWNTYPNRAGSKYKAFEAYEKAILEGITHETLLLAVKAYAKYTAGTEQRYIKHAASWLNGRLWEADYTMQNMPQKQPKLPTQKEI